MKGASDVALGNVVGSNIFNIAVILGITALIRPPNVHLDLIRREIPVVSIDQEVARHALHEVKMRMKRLIMA